MSSLKVLALGLVLSLSVVAASVPAAGVSAFEGIGCLPGK